MPGAAIRNCGQAPRKAKVLSLTHSTHPTPPQLEPLEGSDQDTQPARALRSRGSCHLGAPGWGGSRDGAAVGMCRAPAQMQSLRPGASPIQAQEGRRHRPWHPPPAIPWKIPAPGAQRTTASSKAEARGETELLRKRRAQPNGCLEAGSHRSLLRDTRLARALKGGACAGALTERRRREGTSSTRSLSDDLKARGAELQQPRLYGCLCGL